MNKIFNLNQLPIENWFDGICKEIVYPDLANIPIIPSRGEFVGYISDGQVLKLFRDRIGGRNLYYSSLENKVYVSTDILWVLNHCRGGESIQLNTDYIREEYLPFQVPFNRSTIYEWVCRVLPGEVVTFRSKEIPVHEKYWELSFNEKKFNPNDLHDLILDAVSFRRDIVERKMQELIPQMNPYTSYCSGGIDSSLITSLSNPKEIFSGFYQDELYNELNYIEALGREGLKSIEITEERFYKFLNQLPLIIPDPMCGLGVIPQVIVAMEAFRGGYHYAFTGEGGDEIFYGYPWNTLIIEMAKAVRALTRDRYMARWDDMTANFLEKAFYPMIMTLIEKGTRENINLWDWDNSQPVENNLFRFNIEIGLPAILTVDERVGIYSGVKPVSPLIDHEIIQYVASINFEERARIPKGLLRDALKGIIPDKIRLRYDKMGFPVPYNQWKWEMIPSLLKSLRSRDVVPIFDLEKHKIMDRKTWALVNIELICRMLEEKNEL